MGLLLSKELFSVSPGSDGERVGVRRTPMHSRPGVRRPSAGWPKALPAFEVTHPLLGAHRRASADRGWVRLEPGCCRPGVKELVLLHPYYGLGAQGMVSGPLGIASPMDLGAGNLTPPMPSKLIAKTVTHLVVEPKHRQGFGRLVPLDLVESTSTDEIRLRCTVSEFEKLQPAEETHFLPGTDPFGGYGPGLVLLHPYYGLGAGMVSGPLGIASPMDLGAGNLTPPIIHDLVPEGEVEVRRGEQVHATDGDIGRVQGLVIDPRTHQVTHVLLQEGHLWGRKQVAIPISAVTGVDHGIQLNISKQGVQDLPELDVVPPNG